MELGSCRLTIWSDKPKDLTQNFFSWFCDSERFTTNPVFYAEWWGYQESVWVSNWRHHQVQPKDISVKATDVVHHVSRTLWNVLVLLEDTLLDSVLLIALEESGMNILFHPS